jgi:hypothetical protein
LSRPCERYCEPLRLPGQPAATSGAALIRRGGTPGVRWAGSPVVPGATVRACHPCYPGGSGRAGQLYWLVRHRPSPNVHRVGTLNLVTRLRLGSLHATACAVARPSGALVRELGALGYPAHLPQATRARCPLPGPDFHRQVPEYPRHTTGHQLECNSLILRGHRCTFGAAPAGPGVSRHECRTTHRAVRRPGVGLSG